MYSTSIDSNRFSVKCLTVLEGKFALNNFLVDTGAMITCCKYRFIDQTLHEGDMVSYESKVICGIVSGSTVKFYKYPVKQFTIGNIDMGEQSIWITFDERVTDTVLGMDILRQVVFTANPYNKRIYFCKDADDYNDNFVLETA